MANIDPMQSYDRKQFDTLDHAARRLSFLSEASHRLSSALTNQECFQELLQLMIPEFCDCAVITLLTEHGETKRVALTHIDPKSARSFSVLLDKYPPMIQDDYGTGKVIRTGKPDFEPYLDLNIDGFLKVIRYPELAELLSSLNVLSVICVPLKAYGKTLGALWMGVTSHSSRRFNEDDLKLAEEVANRAALSIHQLFRYEKASQRMERLEVERDLREEFISQVRHDALSALTAAVLAADIIAKIDPEQCGTLAQKVKEAIDRASDIIRKSQSGPK